MTNDKKSALEQLKSHYDTNRRELSVSKLFTVLEELAEHVEALEANQPKNFQEEALKVAHETGDRFGKAINELVFGSNDDRTIELPDDTWNALRFSHIENKQIAIMQRDVKDVGRECIIIGSTTFIRAKKETK